MHENTNYAVVLHSDGDILGYDDGIIVCTRIESTTNATLIYGIREETGKLYEILVASIPSSMMVKLEPIEGIKPKENWLKRIYQKLIV